MERADLTTLLAATGVAVRHGGTFFLDNPRWGRAERTQAEAAHALAAATPGGIERGWLCIPTGGTSGQVRFARHDEQTLTAAAEGFVEHFGLTRVNAVDVLPPFHVSGLLARVRCAITGGTHRAAEWPRLAAGEFPLVGDGEWVLSLVPTQLQTLLAAPVAVAWLRRFRLVLLGGGPLWPELAEPAAAAGVPLVLSYGMTETAAMVTAQRPGEFAAGRRDCGTALPHARISLGEEGTIAVSGDSVFRGYFPEMSEGRRFVTQDRGEIDAEGRLRVLGRRDAAIITGGEKVDPAEVEAVLRATGQFDDVAVIGQAHPRWGEEVIACYPGETPPRDLASVRTAVERELAPFKRPKRYVPVSPWPRTTHGKLNRARLIDALPDSAD